MVLYQYRCTGCFGRTAILQRSERTPLETCPYCGGILEQLISALALQVKRTGGYATDDANRSADRVGEGSAAAGTTKVDNEA